MSDRNARREARALLAKLLPHAKAELLTSENRVEQASGVGKAQAPYLREDNLAGVFIRPAALGGWHADVKLKQVPAGVADTLGTPARMPCRSRGEAMRAAVGLLCFILAVEAQRKEDPAPAPRVFAYFGCETTLPEDILRFMEATTAEHPHLRYGSVARAWERLDEITLELFPSDKVTLEGLQALDREPYAKLMTVLLMAALEGVFRYPEPRAAPPGQPHREAGTSR